MSRPVRIIDAVAGVIVVLGLPVTLALDLFSNLTSRRVNLRRIVKRSRQRLANPERAGDGL